jgi:hypothetical protein
VAILKRIKKYLAFTSLAGLASLPISTQAQTIPEALSLYTTANVAQYFPGFTALQYTNTVAAIRTAFTTNANCITYFNQGIFAPASATTAGTACAAFLDPNLDTATGLPPGTNYDALKVILTTYATRKLTPIISLQLQQATTIRQADTISNVLSSIGNQRRVTGPQRVALDGQPRTGMAAGGEPAKHNGWLAVSGTDIKNDFQRAGYDGDVASFIGGVDYTFDPQWVFGVSFANERSVLKTSYNTGRLQGRSFMAAPYLGYRINDMLSLDASAGLAYGNQNISWAFGANSRNTNQRLSRNFIAANLNADQWMGDWQLSGKGGLIRAEETLDANSDLLAGKVSNRLTQLKVAGRAGYWVKEVMPYAALGYTRDLQNSGYDTLPTGLQDKDGWTATLGVDLFSRNGITGGVYYATEQGRSYLKNDVLMVNLAVRF